MEIRQLSDQLSVAAQITVQDVEHIAAQGFKTILCNRPDGEASDQPEFRLIAQAAQAAGINAQYMPVAPKEITDANIVEFGEGLKNIPSPMLAYCRTGTRCAFLWALSKGASGAPVNEIISAASNAGYDVSKLLPRIESLKS